MLLLWRSHGDEVETSLLADPFAVHRPACIARVYREYRSLGAARRGATPKAAFIVAARVTRPLDTLALLDLAGAQENTRERGEREREQRGVATISIVSASVRGNVHATR